VKPSNRPAPLRIRIHLQPRASRTRIAGWHGEALKITVQAPPVGGAANAALVALLADILDVPRAAVRVVHGAASREKLIEIDADDPAACDDRLRALAAGAR